MTPPEPGLPGEDGRLTPRAHPELVEDRRHLIADRLLPVPIPVIALSHVVPVQARLTGRVPIPISAATSASICSMPTSNSSWPAEPPPRCRSCAPTRGAARPAVTITRARLALLLEP